MIAYCYHCMEQLSGQETVCPHCGHVQKWKAPNERILPPGTILAGKYLLGEMIGEGGFGITYRGIDLNLHLKVAIKEYFPASLASRNIEAATNYRLHVIGGESAAAFQKGLEDYEKEANRLAQFANLPGIVSVLNFFYENATAYMVMDFVDGVTLKEYLNQHGGRLGWQETLDLLHPVIQSLEAVHRAGIIHRDISPDNIMMNQERQMVLIDFGAARKLDQNQQKKTVILKRGYAPVEQYQTNGNQGPWSDVYSICATMYKMISGQKLPDALSIAGGDVRITSLRVLETTVPVKIDEAIQRGLESDIRDRISSMEELEACLYQGQQVRKKEKRSGNGGMIAIGISAGILIIALTAALALVNMSRNGENESAAAGVEGLADTASNQAESEETQYVQNSMEESGSTAENEYERMADTDVSLISYEEIENGMAITGVDYKVTVVVIPAEIEGKQVLEIRGMSPNATSVVIKNGVQKLAADAFRNCVYLESVYIPESVTVIEENAFRNCQTLNDITISPDNHNYYVSEGNLYDSAGIIIWKSK